MEFQVFRQLLPHPQLHRRGLDVRKLLFGTIFHDAECRNLRVRVIALLWLMDWLKPEAVGMTLLIRVVDSK